MKDWSSERVLVIPTELLHRSGIFQGFSPRVDYYLPQLLQTQSMTYRPRAEVETDPSYKQIIPYVLLRFRDELFHYTRGKRGSEERLRALRSVGVGGHITPDDASFFDTPYREAMFREVREEVHLNTSFTERCVGLINDDSSPVGQVHLGIVHVFDLASPNVQRREQTLTQAGFAPVDELARQRDEFETWSQFVLDAIRGVGSVSDWWRAP